MVLPALKNVPYTLITVRESHIPGLVETQEEGRVYVTILEG